VAEAKAEETAVMRKVEEEATVKSAAIADELDETARREAGQSLARKASLVKEYKSEASLARKPSFLRKASEETAADDEDGEAYGGGEWNPHELVEDDDGMEWMDLPEDLQEATPQLPGFLGGTLSLSMYGCMQQYDTHTLSQYTEYVVLCSWGTDVVRA
jgi:hypothetical protein